MSEIEVRPNKWRWLVGLIVVLLVVGGAGWIVGDHKFATPAAEGDHFDGNAMPVDPAGVFRIGTYNIDGGVGLDKKYDLSRTAGVIKDCNFVALNEVHGFLWPADAQNQAQILATKYLFDNWLFAPVERRWGHDDFGNGAVTNLRVEHWQRVPLSSANSDTNRNVLIVRAKVGPKGPVATIFLAHIDRKADSERELELRALTKMFEDAPKPAILLGDMNTPPEDHLAAILRLPDALDVIDDRLPIEQSQGHLDWILLRGLSCLQAGFHEKGVSDHPFFWADVQVDSGAKTAPTTNP